MKDSEITIMAIAGLGLLGILYLINQNTSGFKPVPETQNEAQFEGLAIAPATRYGAGTPLDMSHNLHGWHPGYDPDPSSQPVTQSKHRYPAVPGGNISTIMHKGWGVCVDNMPGGTRDWFMTPPEAAII